MKLGRRRFLALSAVAPAALSACSEDPVAAARRADDDAVPDSDLDAMALAAGLEIVAEAAYREIVVSVTSDRLGEVPAAGAQLLQTAATQHGQCREALNDLLAKAGRKAVTDPNIEFESSVAPGVGSAKGWPEIALLARVIETTLAATYLQTIHSTLQSRATLRLAGGIQATGQKRVAILNFLLGEYPVPDAFQKTDAARRA